MSNTRSLPIEPRTSAAASESERWVDYLILASVLFPLGHGIARVVHRKSHSLPEQLLALLNPHTETSLWTWATVSVLLLVGITSLGLFRAQQRRGWLLPGLLFVYLSADDSAMIHERVGIIMYPFFGETPMYVWLLAVGPLLVLFGSSTLLFLLRTLRDRLQACRDVILGFGAMAAALAIEAAEGYIVRESLMWGTVPLVVFTVMVEEWLELVGPLLVLRAVAGELELELRGLRRPPPTI